MEELRLTAAGLEIAAQASGPVDAIPVLAMHGWLDNSATFTPLRRLLPSNLRLVAVDLPGHGRSQHRPNGQAYHFVDWIVSALAIADALGWDRFRILGHSMGGAIATLVAGACPERVERLVVLDGLGPWTAPDDQAPVHLQKAVQEHRILATKSPREMKDLDEAVTILGHAYTDLSPESLRVLLRRGLIETAQGVHFSYDLKLRAASYLRFTEAQVLSILAAIQAPLLYIRPEKGWPLDDDLHLRRQNSIAHLRRIDIPGGHHAHLEHPERIADEIAAFLSH